MEWLKKLFRKETKLKQTIPHSAHVYDWKRRQQIAQMGVNWMGHPDHKSWNYRPV